ncbi:hypothetical protein D3C73_1172830 [compost metagenome]
MHMLITQVDLCRVGTVAVEHTERCAALGSHQPVKVFAAGAHDLILAAAWPYAQRQRSVVKTHALLCQRCGDVVVVGQYLVRQGRAGRVEYTEDAHQRQVLVDFKRVAMITAAASAAALAIPKVKVGPSSFQL